MSSKWLAFMLFLAMTSIAHADTQKHSVILPVWESEKLTCRWWNANKKTVSQEAVAAIGVAFLRGYEAGRVDAKEIEFNSIGGNEPLSFWMELSHAFTVSQIDDYCASRPHESWTNSLMGIYVKSQSPPPPPPPPPPSPPGMKRQVFDKNLKKWVDLQESDTH